MAQPFGPAERGLRIHRAAARFTKATENQRLPGSMNLNRPLQNQGQSRRRPAEAGRYTRKIKDNRAGGTPALRERAVEEFDYVEDFLVGAAHDGAGAELQDAAGVGCGDDLGFGLLHVVHFSVEEF